MIRMAANSEAKRIPVAGPLLALVTVLALVVAYSYMIRARRTARIDALKSYLKGEADCRLLGSKYLDMSAKEEAEACKSAEGSEQRNQHLFNVSYYKKLANISYSVAESNAGMIQKLNHELNKP